jgi:hypothetical protein
LLEVPEDRLCSLEEFKAEIFFEGCDWGFGAEGGYVEVRDEPPGFDRNIGDLDVVEGGEDGEAGGQDLQSPFKDF